MNTIDAVLDDNLSNEKLQVGMAIRNDNRNGNLNGYQECQLGTKAQAIKNGHQLKIMDSLATKLAVFVACMHARKMSEDHKGNVHPEFSRFSAQHSTRRRSPPVVQTPRESVLWPRSGWRSRWGQPSHCHYSSCDHSHCPNHSPSSSCSSFHA
jgi:hypothetical protein